MDQRDPERHWLLSFSFFFKSIFFFLKRKGVQLIQLTGQHVHVSTVGNAENMGRDFITTFANVHRDDTFGVDRETLVRVDGDAEKTRVGLFIVNYDDIIFRITKRKQELIFCFYLF